MSFVGFALRVIRGHSFITSHYNYDRAKPDIAGFGVPLQEREGRFSLSLSPATRGFN